MLSKLRGVLLTPVLVVAGAFIAYTAQVDGRNYKAITDHGKTTEAIIERVTWKKKTTGLEKDFKIDVEFETENKQSVKKTLSVSDSEGRRIRDTNTNSVKVKYLPESPSTAIVANAADDSTFMMSVGGGLAALGVGVFVFRRRKKAAEAAMAA